MKNLNETCKSVEIAVENENTSPKEAYVKPEIQVVKMELEQPILADSSNGSGPDYGNGGRY